MKLTIIVPMLNHEQTIKAALTSINSNENYNIICVDGGSKDRTVEMVEELSRELKNISIIHHHQPSLGSCINRGLMSIEHSEDASNDAFMVLLPNSVVLPSRLNMLTTAFQSDSNIDIVIGQVARDYHGEWRSKTASEMIQSDSLTTLSHQPELLYDMTFNAKLFSTKFLSLRCNEDINLAYSHLFIAKALTKATDIQLVPNIIIGDNSSDRNLSENVEFSKVSSQLRFIRQQVMESLLLQSQKLIYSEVMDINVYNELLQVYLTQHSTLTLEFISEVATYIEFMQQTDYLYSNIFDIVDTVERFGSDWTNETYEIWKNNLVNIGIKRPGLRKFKLQLIAKKIMKLTNDNRR
ncbi:glycosyltransferase family 2 protein [Staphylococcus simiae]|uniref:glycosyltransferase family 2 protein n=1 Tax=Staphylococcus simiae TaxID=308354 RepID=UPI001A964B3F|nr:glycosyltransferase family A protein [Staphylococcus simiae]MBO1198817.1 glycosyltransferase family 2 protein [Staphylococcus simiae]MBO1201014.1 glycosyltransferase family 2 protein [Staphylococcus simiae]MBO1203830.1 glycosyltransferase family 2 protein [Staphylococcus simiae]MBO1211054.1 glycosyltransferase family 2 protein [Staphylococcus simiae]MBO1229393.1 glycosyltransferase family 2 protein [Staphylococcus simiae]